MTREERNIKLSLQKAREFYNKGGELKDLALYVFTEEEILAYALPKTWKEFCKNNPITPVEYYLTDMSNIDDCKRRQERDIEADRNVLPSIEAAKQHLALMQLHQLRDCYRQGWIPDFNSRDSKYCIVKCRKEAILIVQYDYLHRFLSFQTKELAEEFLNNFRDLIEQAGDLI